MKHTRLAIAALLLASGMAFSAAAQDQAAGAPAATLPAWEQLTPAQRDLLVAPMRERWNNRPADRARMLAHAQRWQEMTPEQRQHARRGMHRWEKMDPEHRKRMRALFHEMRGMTGEQRKVLREQWHAMTPEQRKAWVAEHAPKHAD